MGRRKQYDLKKLKIESKAIKIVKLKLVINKNNVNSFSILQKKQSKTKYKTKKT